jgi:hypothetical protein
MNQTILLCTGVLEVGLARAGRCTTSRATSTKGA